MISLPKVQSAYLPRAQTRDARPAAISAGLDAQKSISLGDNLLVAAVRPLYLLANKFCNSTKSWTMYTFDQMSAYRM